jgi:hypothetical protein
MHPYRYALINRVWHLIDRPDAHRAVCGAYVGEARQRAVEVPDLHVCGNCTRVQYIRLQRLSEDR